MLICEDIVALFMLLLFSSYTIAGGLTWSVPALRDIRAALFLSGGSSTQSSHPSGHVIGPRGHMTEKPSAHAVTPLAPRYFSHVHDLR